MSHDFSRASLRDYYERAYRPTFLSDCRPATLAVYETTLALWELLGAHGWLNGIDNQELGLFRTRLIQRGLSPHTVNKYLRCLNALLGKAGPPGRNARDALGILPAAPWVKLVKAPTTRPRAIPLDVLGLIYRACEVARVPRADGIDPVEWWRGLIVCASQTGIRRGALLGLTWNDWDFPVGTLRVAAELDKMGVERVKPINSVVEKHLLGLHRVACQLDPEKPAHLNIFPWPFKSLRMFRIQWHAIQQAAGVPDRGHYKFHDLKKTCGTQLATVAGAHAVREMLDHTTVEMGQRYVAGGEALREALEKMPRPAEFERAGARPAAAGGRKEP